MQNSIFFHLFLVLYVLLALQLLFAIQFLETDTYRYKLPILYSLMVYRGCLAEGNLTVSPMEINYFLKKKDNYYFRYSHYIASQLFHKFKKHLHAA